MGTKCCAAIAATMAPSLALAISGARGTAEFCSLRRYGSAWTTLRGDAKLQVRVGRMKSTSGGRSLRCGSHPMAQVYLDGGDRYCFTFRIECC